jgi:hypothetical protein
MPRKSLGLAGLARPPYRAAVVECDERLFAAAASVCGNRKSGLGRVVMVVRLEGNSQAAKQEPRRGAEALQQV